MSVLGHHVYIVDAASFLSMFRLIFVDQVYRFEAESKSPVILDCGANIGLSVMYFKRFYRDARIVAFEADPEICSVLRTNVTENRLDQVEIVQSAVWTCRSTVYFLPDRSDGGQVVGEGSGGTIRVPCIRLRDYLSQPIDLLKLDIEGAETDVLLDCLDRLHQVREVILEYHSFAKQPQRLDEILRIFREQGFRYYLGMEQVPVNPNQPITTYRGIDQGLLIYALPREKVRCQSADF